MRKALSVPTVAAISFALSACVNQQIPGPSNTVIQRVLKDAPGAAQPSTIVSTELAYARAAKERGFANAASDYAAPGALLHGRYGVVPFENVADDLRQADIQTQWAPRLVVKSCDGSLALSQGRFVDREGKVGNYVTTWARQPDGSYKWTYDAAGLDDPQPSQRPDFEDGDIVVTAMDVVQGLIATCSRGDEAVPPPPAIPVGEGGASAAQISRDGTLRWRWEHRTDGVKYVTADYFFEGQWVTAIEEELASASEE